MKIYVCGGFEERDLISGFMRRLEGLGHAITCDWTKAEAQVPGKTSDAELSDEEQQTFALTDLVGVADADFVWHIVAGYKGSRGAYVELGYAMGMRTWRSTTGGEVDTPMAMPYIIASGSDVRKSIFHSLCDKTFPSHEEAFEWIASTPKGP